MNSLSCSKTLRVTLRTPQHPAAKRSPDCCSGFRDSSCCQNTTVCTLFESKMAIFSSSPRSLKHSHVYILEGCSYPVGKVVKEKLPVAFFLLHKFISWQKCFGSIYIFFIFFFPKTWMSYFGAKPIIHSHFILKTRTHCQNKKVKETLTLSYLLIKLGPSCFHFIL